MRTPGYLKGKSGWVEAVIGPFPNPEDLAYGLSGLPERNLYKVGFRQADLWDDYEGPAEDRPVRRCLRTLARARRRRNVVSDHHPHEEATTSPYAARIRAIEALLLEKGVLTEPEVQDGISYMEARSPANGAKLVARAWIDDGFKDLLLSDGKAAASALGHGTPSIPPSSSSSRTRRRYTT